MLGLIFANSICYTAAQSRGFPDGDRPKVIISEFMPKPLPNDLVDEDGDASDWIELHNVSTNDTALGGWSLISGEARKIWFFPNTTLPVDSYLVVMASGKNRTTTPVLHTNFRLESNGQEYLALADESGGVVWEHPFEGSSTDINNPSSGTSLGIPVSREIGDYRPVPLLYPTPGAMNTEAEGSPSPFLAVMDSLQCDKGIPQRVRFWVTFKKVASREFSNATVCWRLNFGKEHGAELTPTVSLSSSSPKLIMHAVQISSIDIREGDFLEWRYTVNGNCNGGAAYSEHLPGDVHFQHGGGYHGCIFEGLSFGVPSLHIWTARPGEAASNRGAYGQLVFNSKVYEDIFVRRRGQTTLSWSKPKLKIEFKHKDFRWDTLHGANRSTMKPVSKINLNSLYKEPGELTYFREPLAYQAMKYITFLCSVFGL
eukprot:CAMPEP_0177760884 /NCGR_PEP_ID=MMETSP0491_2-20121128/5508_1 /TAXON_ID=63592 /ORGANISM="Tetraselmis chuii, Strain PLY429" /LENGTH=426 /DNA_ID=CAMNT_0019276819 /DNA_START=324 /DNA_END=1604 /DNA_ORIENTATION=-